MPRTPIRFDLETSYRAIRDAVRRREHIAIDRLAALNGEPKWTAAVSKRTRTHLHDLAVHATRHGWPMPGALVLPKIGVYSKRAIEDLATSAERCGALGGAHPLDFLAEQQNAMRVWAQVVPDHLGFSGRTDADAEPSFPEDAYDLRISYPAIREAARRRGCIPYQRLAALNGDAAWSKAMLQRIEIHLEHLNAHARRYGWAMPSAVVLPDASGPCGGSPLTFSADDASGDYAELGVSKQVYLLGVQLCAGDYALPGVTDPVEFLHKQQAAMFAWAQVAPDHLGFSERV